MGDSGQLCDQGAFDLNAACRFTGMKKSYLYGLMESGRLPYCKLGVRRVIPKAGLVRLLGEALVRPEGAENAE
jgi:hypothetical protein